MKAPRVEGNEKESYIIVLKSKNEVLYMMIEIGFLLLIVLLFVFTT